MTSLGFGSKFFLKLPHYVFGITNHCIIAKLNKTTMIKNKNLQKFLKDSQLLFSIPINKRYLHLLLDEHPFDAQLLSISRLYRESRKQYLALDGSYVPRVCSTMRALSSHDLFKYEIEFTPLLSELRWFTQHHQEIADPNSIMNAISCFGEISLFHEQNHRILWRLLPPAPDEQSDVCRYLNFAESLVVTLDLALGDEVGPRLSSVFERFKSLYRPSGNPKWASQSKKEYRQYLQILLYVTYLVLELIEPKDIPKAVNYMFPANKAMNKAAVKRGMELSEAFTLNTNRMWQMRRWKTAQLKLESFHKNSIEDTLYLPEDPLDFEEEFIIANRIFDYFGL
ncbi:MAG: hypothetical protein ACXWRP_12000 [Bdellovibrio sp.]